MKGRINGSDGHGSTAHGFKNALEVSTLQRQQFVERLPTLFLAIGQYHFSHGSDFSFSEEHMLRATQSDSLGSKGYRGPSLIRLIGIGSNL